MPCDAMPIGELSRRTGCNIETIRYYEKIALIPKADRRGRYRSYGLADIQRLRFIRRSRELGFTLEEIRNLLAIATTGQASCSEARSIAAAHLKDVRTRMSDLRRMERILSSTVKACDAGNHDACPLIETLSTPPR